MKNIRMIFCLFVVIVVVSSSAHSDQNDPRLNLLFEKLKLSGSESSAQRIEQEIWSVWLEHPDENVRSSMNQGISAMQSGHLEIAESIFSSIILTHPNFSEVWNKRATVRFVQGNYRGSTADIMRVINLEPRHFGALSGLGMIFIKRGDLIKALKVYEVVFKLYPNMPNLADNIAVLRRRLSGYAL